MKENKKIPKVMHSNSLTVSGDEQGGNNFFCYDFEMGCGSLNNKCTYQCEDCNG